MWLQQLGGIFPQTISLLSLMHLSVFFYSSIKKDLLQNYIFLGESLT